MPHIEEDLDEGFQITREDGRLQVVRVFFGEDLSGASPTAQLASMLSMTNGGSSHTGADVPAENEALVVQGKTLYATRFHLTPWSPHDGQLTVTYTQNTVSAADPETGFGPCQISGGTSVQQAETQFDAANLALPYASRTPIQVVYDPTSLTAPGAGMSAKPQGGKVPILKAQSAQTWTRTETSDPSTRSRTYCGKKNATAFKGMAPGTALMLDISYTSPNAGATYTVSYTIGYDPEGKWDQVMRYIDPDTGKPPKLINSQLVNENGIKLIVVQGEAEFNDLNLTP